MKSIYFEVSIPKMLSTKFLSKISESVYFSPLSPVPGALKEIDGMVKYPPPSSVFEREVTRRKDITQVRQIKSVHLREEG